MPISRLARPIEALACALALAVLTVACGGGGAPTEGEDNADPPGQNPPGQNPPGAPPGSLGVNMLSNPDIYGDGNAFSPAQGNLALNGTVTWTNNSGEIHNVTFAPAAGAPANITDLPTGTASRTFATAGTYEYQCTNHVGMAGSVTVIP